MSNDPIALPSIPELLKLRRKKGHVLIADSGTEFYIYSEKDQAVIMFSGVNFGSMTEAEFNAWFQAKITEIHNS